MDIIENKLYSNNPINISNLISKIINNVKRKHAEGLRDFPEVKFLKEKMMNADPLISEVSGKAIMMLISDRILSADVIHTDFISSMNSIKCLSTLTNILGDLLCLLPNDKNYVFKLYSPQHPFITLIMEKPDAAYHIFVKIQNLLEDFDGSMINKVFEPFYLYCLCCPSRNNIELLRCRLWALLLNSKDAGTRLFGKIISWLQVKKKEEIQIINNHFIEALRNPNIETILNIEVVILWHASLLYNMALYKFDMQPALCCLRQIFENRKLVMVDSILLIFSQIIDVCSPIHLKNILLTCKPMLDQEYASLFALETLKASLLPWLTSPCTFLNEAHQLAKEIITSVNKTNNANYKLNVNEKIKDFSFRYKNLICTNKMIFITVNLTLNLERFSEEQDLKEWLEEIKQIPDEYTVDIFNFLCGFMMIEYQDPEISLIILELLLKCAEKEIIFSSKLLTLILYKLSNNLHPNYHFALLKSLPKLVIFQDNIPKVMALIRTVSKRSENLFNVGISLAFDAWKINNKCYIYLEDLLVHDTPVEKKWERYVTKAYVLKELCDRKPELYGKDAVAHLSKILNDCDNENGALPCSLAIEAITILCRNGIIDIQTTWSTLAPKFTNDRRLPVVKSLCSLIKEVPQLLDSDSYKDLFEAVTKKLWEYVEYGDTQISEAALSSLVSFGIEHISKTLPEKYLEPESVSTAQSVLGKTWIYFLIENRASDASVQFIKNMMSIEIDGYLKYVYQQKGPKEPINYNYLPTHSIVKEIGVFIKAWVNKWRGSIHNKLYIECLKIFSEVYSKPLPPLDWCFLQELIHDPKTKEYAVDIASHQVVMSGTARRLIDNYLITVTENPKEEDILLIFKNLKYLVRSIQPMILRPFFEISIWHVLKQDTDEYNLIDGMFDQLKIVLREENVQETNKITIVQVLDGIIFTTDVNSKLFKKLCEVMAVAPTKCLKEATCVKITDNAEDFPKSVEMRCALAKNAKMTPLDWINDLIDVWSMNYRDTSIWPDLVEVLKTHIKNTEESVPWCLDLIGRIQAKVADRSEVLVISCLFDVLIYVVVHFSGFYTFINKNRNEYKQIKELFPASLAALLDRVTWEACSAQVLEWLFHMNAEETISKDYRNLFGRCLQALKHNEDFTKNDKFLKYISSSTIDCE
ncbi:focadhesin isoform X2 [Diorhabda carinulata]|uniref:focadhesin isoform X2 n=1 Tax=Diorhabda carinulata TaxID=1163345 RepID=UPI0025A18744|nr:focadhesin isoform X2 [Diorhabda carinulata]